MGRGGWWGLRDRSRSSGSDSCDSSDFRARNHGDFVAYVSDLVRRIKVILACCFDTKSQ